MAVPPETALDSPATHRLVTGYCVLHEAGQQMPVVGESVRKWRAVVKHVLVFAPGPGLYRSRERAVFRPEREHAFFERGVIRLLRNLGIRRGHGAQA